MGYADVVSYSSGMSGGAWERSLLAKMRWKLGGSKTRFWLQGRGSR